jgi:PAS domain S-box-containing protein
MGGQKKSEIPSEMDDPEVMEIYSKGFLQSVIDGIQDSITIVDRSYRILFANRAARERVVLNPENRQIVGQICFETYHNQDRPCVFCLTSRTFEDGKAGTTTFSKEDENGQERFLELYTYPIKEKNGEVGRVIEISRDITERKRLEMQLVQASKMAALGELAGGLAHQLNNPLVGVQNFVQLLLSRMDPDDPNRNLAETVERAGKECSKIIRNLLRFSRESHHDFTEIDPARIIEDVLSLLEKQLTLSGVRIETDLSEELPVILGNETQLAQVFMNIIHNGAQAIDDSGTITIRLRAGSDGKNVFVEIVDTGRGIPRNCLDRIFEPFFTTKEDGTGLGLSVAYGIVKNHGGSIHVESEEGKGSTFIVTLPTHGREEEK